MLRIIDWAPNVSFFFVIKYIVIRFLFYPTIKYILGSKLGFLKL